jgi:hypothetical protein
VRGFLCHAPSALDFDLYPIISPSNRIRLKWFTVAAIRDKKNVTHYRRKVTMDRDTAIKMAQDAIKFGKNA